MCSWRLERAEDTTMFDRCNCQAFCRVLTLENIRYRVAWGWNILGPLVRDFETMLRCHCENVDKRARVEKGRGRRKRIKKKRRGDRSIVFETVGRLKYKKRNEADG